MKYQLIENSKNDINNFTKNKILKLPAVYYA